MGKLNKLYRAFIDYRKVTATDSDLKRERKTYKFIDKDLEYFEAIKINCTIEEDWVKEIESKIEYVTKAVNEERQFIETIGEVVPIEKVKKVSKDSVKHLAKHSNLITKLPENEEDDIIPEKLYMVEKISDYTVYENRFLYMLLCYMRDFIDLRVSKIQEAIATYKSDFKMKKTMESKSRTLIFETSLFEDRKDNPYPLLNEKTQNLLERIDTFAHDVQALLKTDLMQQVSEAPMIKPPITKTNVLKMNNNFKNAVALYEYLASYDKVGYSLEEVKVNLEPFVDPMSDEIVEMVSLTSFLSYKYGNNLEDMLREEYEEEERLKRIEELKRNAEQIKALKKRIKESGMGQEEYMLMLEKQNRQLEKDSADLVVAKNEILALKEQIETIEKEKEVLRITIEELNKTIEDLNLEIERLNKKYIEDMAKKDAEHKAAIEKLTLEHSNEIAKLKENHQSEVSTIITKYSNEIAVINTNNTNHVKSLTEKYNTELSQLMENHENEIDDLNTKYNKEIVALEDAHEKEKQEIFDDYNAQVSDLTTRNEVLSDHNEDLMIRLEENRKFLNEETLRMEQERRDIIDECNKNIRETIHETNREIMAARSLTEAAIEETRYANAKLNALKKLHGMFTDEDDFTSKERFNELELQKKAFNKLYKEEWKKTKKRIKREIFEINNPIEKTELEEVLESDKLSVDEIKKIENSILEEMNNIEDEIAREPEMEEVLEPVELEEVKEENISELTLENEIESEVLEEIDEEITLEQEIETDNPLEEILDSTDETVLEDILEDIDENEEIEDLEDEESVDTKGLVGFDFAQVRFRTLDEKLGSMSEDLANIYNEVKNSFMRYENISAKMSKSYDCIFLGGRIVAKLSVTSTKLKVYLAVDPDKYPTSQFPHKDLSEKKTHARTPYFALVKSPLSVRRIKKVFDDLMVEKNVRENDNYENKDYISVLKTQ